MTLKMLTIFLGVICLINVSGQRKSGDTTKVNVSARKSSIVQINHKEILKNSFLKSKASRNVSIRVELVIQNKPFTSVFKYQAPNHYYLFETKSGMPFKEAIEIAGQRFQKKEGQWIKTRKDYYPLRDQFDSYFPVKFDSKKDDIIKIKEVKVNFLGEVSIEDKKFSKYYYEISYRDINELESGISWVNQANGLLEIIETENCGIFGATRATWNYNFDNEIKINAPKDYIEKDWVN